MIQAIPHAPVLGTGIGSLREVYPTYLNEDRKRPYYYSHAENGPLQIVLEGGLVGLGLLLAGLGYCGHWCFRALRRAPSSRWFIVAGAIAASLTVSVVHSLVDFVWYVPGCMTMTVILAACACRLCQLACQDDRQHRQRQPLSKPIRLTMLVALGVVGASMLSNRWGPVVAERHWHRYLLLEREASVQPSSGAVAATRQASDFEALAAQEEMLGELKAAAKWEPDNARVQLALACEYLRRFQESTQGSDNAMPLSQICDAAMEAQFPRRSALDEWLSRSIGPAARDLDSALDHARRGLAACPLIGEGYLQIADLVFLEGHSREARRACVRQGLAVRPYDATVLFRSGLEAWTAGDHEEGLGCWQRAFRADRRYQEWIFACLADRSPSGECEPQIRFLLEAFKPDLAGLKILYQQYRKIGSLEELRLLRQHYLSLTTVSAATLPHEKAANLWLELNAIYSEANEGEESLTCARHALRELPDSYPVRWALVQALFAQGRLQESEPHIEWCLRRHPRDSTLLRMLTEAVKHRISQSRSGGGLER